MNSFGYFVFFVSAIPIVLNMFNFDVASSVMNI